MPENGFLVIADITGYTRFLTGSELTHAAGVLEELFTVILERLKSPLILSNIQGDAFLSFATDETVESTGQIFDTIEALYFGFRERLSSLINNTTCTCRACSNAPNLDLKFIVHYGEFIVQDIGNRKELAGSEVILLHRLLKNDVRAKTGVGSYALFTDAATRALDLDEITAAGLDYETELDAFGKLNGKVIDFADRWRRYADTHETVADKDNLWFAASSRTVSQQIEIVWEAYWNPAKRDTWYASLQNIRRVVGDSKHLRTGAVEHCAHGKQDLVLRYVDVRPLRYATLDSVLPFGGYLRHTFAFQRKGGNTIVSEYWDPPMGRGKISTLFLRLFFGLMYKKSIQAETEQELDNFVSYLTDNAPVVARGLDVTQLQVTGAVGTVLSAH